MLLATSPGQHSSMGFMQPVQPAMQLALASGSYTLLGAHGLSKLALPIPRLSTLMVLWFLDAAGTS